MSVRLLWNLPSASMWWCLFSRSFIFIASSSSSSFRLVSHSSFPSFFPSPSFYFDFDFVSDSSSQPSSSSPVLLFPPSLGESGIREPCWCQTATMLHVHDREAWDPSLSCTGAFPPDPPLLLPPSNSPSSDL